MSETYLEAFGRRMKRIDELLLELVKTFSHYGYEVYLAPGFHFILILSKSKNKHIYVGFGELPYHWYLSCAIEQSEKNGSGRTIAKDYSVDAIDTMQIPWNEEQIFDHMQPIPKSLTYNYLSKYE
jgi:hypothetical protein